MILYPAPLVPLEGISHAHWVNERASQKQLWEFTLPGALPRNVLGVRTSVSGPVRLEVLQSTYSKRPHGHIQGTFLKDSVQANLAPSASCSRAQACWLPPWEVLLHPGREVLGKPLPLGAPASATRGLMRALSCSQSWRTNPSGQPWAMPVLTAVTPAGLHPLHVAGRQESLSRGKRFPGMIPTLGSQSCCSQWVK